MGMIGYPVTDEELDSAEMLAASLVEAIVAGDNDTAYIIAQTATDPALLSMFATEIALTYYDEEDSDG